MGSPRQIPPATDPGVATRRNGYQGRLFRVAVPVAIPNRPDLVVESNVTEIFVPDTDKEYEPYPIVSYDLKGYVLNKTTNMNEPVIITVNCNITFWPPTRPGVEVPEDFMQRAILSNRDPQTRLQMESPVIDEYDIEIYPDKSRKPWKAQAVRTTHQITAAPAQANITPKGRAPLDNKNLSPKNKNTVKIPATQPSRLPAKEPTKLPSKEPTKFPAKEMTKSPVREAMKIDTKVLTKLPEKEGTILPLKEPTKFIAKNPTKMQIKSIPKKEATKFPQTMPVSTVPVKEKQVKVITRPAVVVRRHHHHHHHHHHGKHQKEKKRDESPKK